MSHHVLNVLVTGATGHQGGAVTRQLLEKGHRVRALTRNPGSPAADEIRRRGGTPVAGSFEDRASLEQALRGVDAVFAMGTPYEAGPEAEARHGRALADAAAAVGTAHFVYTSVADADKRTGIPHFDSKRRVEEYIRSLGIPHTVIAPVFFMDNLLSPWFLPGLQGGEFTLALPPERTLQMIAVKDIGAVAALVIENPERFIGRRIDIAGDELSPEQAARTLTDLSGRLIRHRHVPIEALRAANPDWAAMFEWFDKVGYSADVAGLRRDYPEVDWHTFRKWASGQDWSTLLAAKEQRRAG